MVTAAQTAKSPFIRLADRYALLLLPVTLIVAGGAWLLSGDPIRALAVLVAATPCPLILAAPVAFIAGVSQAARKGILIKGGGPLEALARTRNRHVRQDRHADGRRSATHRRGDGARRERRRGFAATRARSSRPRSTSLLPPSSRPRAPRGSPCRCRSECTKPWDRGSRGVIDGKRGLRRFAPACARRRKPEEWAARVLRRASWRSALSVFVAVDGRHHRRPSARGRIAARDAARRADAAQGRCVARIVMVTGDRADAAETIGAALDSTRCWPIACPPTRSMRSQPSSVCGRR